MDNIHPEYFLDWPYDKALLWMENAYKEVLSNRQRIFVACGFHSENLITLGKDKQKNKLDPKKLLSSQELIIRQIDRGGGATAHEPGQMVLYPVLCLKNYGLSVNDLIELMQNTMLLFIKNLGLLPAKDPKNPGVFLCGKKVGFIGMRIKDGISLHGLALNLDNSIKTFELIDPCGIKDMPITSLRDHVAISKDYLVYGQKLMRCFIAILQAKLII